jgi:hypothetical protein
MSLKTSILHEIESRAERPYWDVWLTFFCSVYVFLIAFPSYHDLLYNQLLQFQIAHPFSRIPDNVLHSTHLQKYQFRIAIPIICKLLHLKGYWPLLIQYISAYLLLLFSYRLSFKITLDKVAASLCTIAAANIFAGMIGIHDVYWHFDCFALLMLVLAMYTNIPLLCSVCLLTASFTDERAFIASSLVFVFKMVSNKSGLTQFKDLFSIQTASVVFIWVLYLTLRVYLIHAHSFFTGTMDIGPSLLFYNYNTFPLCILFVFEGAWLFIFLGIYKSLQDRLFLVLVGGATCVILGVALMIADVSRSTAYLYPLFFIGLHACVPYYKKYALRKILLISTFLCILIPTQQVSGDRIFGLGPIFPKVIKLFY